MIRSRFKKVLLIAPQIPSNQLTTGYENVMHIHAIDRVFPSIYELNPNLIVFDYNYVSKDVEKIVRRIRTNNFYNKIKICCYKTKAEPKADSLLKAIGVDYFVYQEELKAAQKSKNILNIFSVLLDTSILGLASNPTN